MVEWFIHLLPLLIFLALGLSILITLLTGVCFYRLFHPIRLTPGIAAARGWWIDPSDAGANHDEWMLDFDRQYSCPVWDIDHPVDLTRPIIVMTHDWGGSRIASLQRIAALIPHTSRITMWDMPGHGDTTTRGNSARTGLGFPESSLLSNLVDRLPRDRPVVLYGFGLGARISMEAARQNANVIGVIVEAPTANYKTELAFVLRRYALPDRVIGSLVRLLSRWRHTSATTLQTVESASRLTQPVLVLPFAQLGSEGEHIAQEVADAASASQYVETNGSIDAVAVLGDPSAKIDAAIHDFIRMCTARYQQEKRKGRHASRDDDAHKSALATE